MKHCQLAEYQRGWEVFIQFWYAIHWKCFKVSACWWVTFEDVCSALDNICEWLWSKTIYRVHALVNKVSHSSWYLVFICPHSNRSEWDVHKSLTVRTKYSQKRRTKTLNSFRFLCFVCIYKSSMISNEHNSKSTREYTEYTEFFEN